MKNLHPFILTALGFALIAPAVQAQTPPPAPQVQTPAPAPQAPAASNADIQTLLGQVAGAYRSLTALSVTMTETQTAGTNERKTVTKLTLKKPDLLTAEITIGDNVRHVVADGKIAYSDSSQDKTKYVKQPAADFQGAIAALGANGGTGVGLFPILLTSPAAEKQIIPGVPKSLKRLDDQKIGSDNCDVVLAIIGNAQQSSRFQFAFGKEDHLLRQLSIGPDSEGAKPSIVETYSDINLQPTVTDTTFTYTPAAGATATEPPKEPSRFDPRLKVGATPLPISGKDLAGKPITLDQFKGKVLLLDFWATWCGPCVGELPNVIAAYGKYHSKGFEVVGISLDQENARPKLEAFIKDHNMPWQQIYDGKYWEAGNAVAYGVRAIPFTLLIGRDGKIAAVGARGPALAPAIEAALGKQQHASR
jgi:outer membrane lipoprotein-sorting protein/peroxiredoxin